METKKCNNCKSIVREEYIMGDVILCKNCYNTEVQKVVSKARKNGKE